MIHNKDIKYNIRPNTISVLMYQQATILDGCLKHHQQKGKVLGISEKGSILACKIAYNHKTL